MGRVHELQPLFGWTSIDAVVPKIEIKPFSVGFSQGAWHFSWPLQHRPAGFDWTGQSCPHGVSVAPHNVSVEEMSFLWIERGYDPDMNSPVTLWGSPIKSILQLCPDHVKKKSGSFMLFIIMATVGVPAFVLEWNIFQSAPNNVANVKSGTPQSPIMTSITNTILMFLMMPTPKIIYSS